MFIYYVSKTIIIKGVNIILSGNYDTLLNFDAFAGISSHKYGFTDSEFLAFIADLDPTEYILVITVVTILININLNIFEQYVVSGALLDIAVTSQNMVQQRGFQLARQGEAVSQQRSEYRQENFDNLYSEVDRLTEELNQLKSKIFPQQTD